MSKKASPHVTNIARGEWRPLAVVNYTHRYHPHPRLSANQLADYLTAGAVARKNILRDAKFPSTAMTIRYEEARRAVVARLAGAENILEHAVAKLRRKSETEITQYCRKNCELCIGAIESFRGGITNLNAGKTIFRKPDLHNTKLRISGVNVSVSIDLMTEETSKDSKRSIGAAILVFSRSEKNQEEMERRCKATALLIFQLLKSQANTSLLVDLRCAWESTFSMRRSTVQ